MSSKEYQEWLPKEKVTPETKAYERFPSLEMQKEECYSRPQTEEDPVGVGLMWGLQIYNYIQEQKKKE